MSASPDVHDADNDTIVLVTLIPAACKTLRDSTEELQIQTTRSCIAGGSCEEFSLESIKNKEGKIY